MSFLFSASLVDCAGSALPRRDDRQSAPTPVMDASARRADEGRELPPIRTGELELSADPVISEWGNPVAVMGDHPRLNT